MKKYRHEYKYISPEYILQMQQTRLASVMELDGNTGDAGCYAIRSIYFDDMYNTCFSENENGTDPREKFRIRIYNCSKSRISLELKQKVNGMCLKTSCPVPLETLEQIMAGSVPDFSAETPYLLKKLICQMNFRMLRPVEIVAYERVPFIYRDGNVRVTFDRNLRSSSNIQDFFDENAPFRSVFPDGTNMMEVKFDELLPDFINEVCQCGQLQWSSFSKYYVCRKFDLHGIRSVFPGA
ncbi:polyphosphate polymerase domain-containing protein [Treponema sp.]|uniref:polyphosphate polymerase domain-containing protein n=1 Tax=Treponema sp. TaxID=166 RepID=UPI003F0C45D7